MTEVELPDGTILEFPAGMSQADMLAATKQYVAGNNGRPSMQQRVESAKAGTLQASPEALQRASQADSIALQGMNDAAQSGGVMGGVRAADEFGRNAGRSLLDNVFGMDDGRTSPGEAAAPYVRGATAAVARGIADVPALPANLAQLAAMGVEKATGMEKPSAVSRGLNALPDTRDMLGAVPVIGPESQYKAPGTAGEYISTAGEFAGGAGVVGGPSAMLKYGALPGAASEAAGQATEGTPLEPYARTAAAIATPLALSRGLPTAQTPGRDAERVRAANTLERAGVKPSAGQATGSDLLRRAEGMAEPSSRQIDDFTAAAMKMVGSPAKTARPENLRAAQKAITDRMDDLVSGINIRVPQQVAQSIDDVMAKYNRHITAGNKSNALEEISDELIALSRNSSNPAPASLLKTWRADIGKLTTSNDTATREAAHGFRTIIDSLTDDAMRQAGRAKDIVGLEVARRDYRNYLAVEDAASRAAAEGGRISPVQLNEAIKRTQGRKNYATGRGTEMMDFSRAGAEIFRPLPTVSAGGVRALELAPQIAGAGLGAAASGGSLTAMAAGALLPTLGRGLLNSPAFQGAIKNPVKTVSQLAPTAPGLLSMLAGSK